MFAKKHGKTVSLAALTIQRKINADRSLRGNRPTQPDFPGPDPGQKQF
jgi:hypothetical protein